MTKSDKSSVLKLVFAFIFIINIRKFTNFRVFSGNVPINSQYPKSSEIIDDLVQSENARSDENLENEELDFEEENQNFDSVDLGAHPEIRKYLDQKYPDDPNEPKKKLIIISAMFRSGSSFVGSLFGMGLKPNSKQFLVVGCLTVIGP